MSLERGGQVSSPWIRYDLQRHANGSIGGYVCVCEGYALQVESGVVLYRDEADMLEQVGWTRQESGCQIRILLDGEDVEAPAPAGTRAVRASPIPVN